MRPTRRQLAMTLAKRDLGIGSGDPEWTKEDDKVLSYAAKVMHYSQEITPEMLEESLRKIYETDKIQSN